MNHNRIVQIVPEITYRRESRPAQATQSIMHASSTLADNQMIATQSHSDKIHNASLVRQTQLQDRVQMEEKDKNPRAENYQPTSDDPNILAYAGMIIDPPLFAQLLRMEQEAHEAQLKQSAAQEQGKVSREEEEYYQKELSRWEGSGSEYQKSSLFTPAQAQALSRGFIALTFEWMEEDNAKAVVPQIFPEKREDERVQFLAGLYDYNLPVNPEYAESVALNILSLLKKFNPDQDISETIEYMITFGYTQTAFPSQLLN